MTDVDVSHKNEDDTNDNDDEDDKDDENDENDFRSLREDIFNKIDNIAPSTRAYC